MQKRPRRRPRGFTLVELLVVVTIIVILVSLGVAVASAVYAKAQRDQAKVILRALANAAGDYRASTGGQVVVVSDAATGIEKFLTVVDREREPNVRNPLLDVIREKYIILDRVDGFGNKFFRVRDPWGSVILYVHNNPRGTSPPDDTVPPSVGPVFVSIGPDLKGGKYAADGRPDAAARDNLDSNTLE